MCINQSVFSTDVKSKKSEHCNYSGIRDSIHLHLSLPSIQQAFVYSALSVGEYQKVLEDWLLDLCMATWYGYGTSVIDLCFLGTTSVGYSFKWIISLS